MARVQCAVVRQRIATTPARQAKRLPEPRPYTAVPIVASGRLRCTGNSRINAKSFQPKAATGPAPIHIRSGSIGPAQRNLPRRSVNLPVHQSACGTRSPDNESISSRVARTPWHIGVLLLGAASCSYFRSVISIARDVRRITVLRFPAIKRYWLTYLRDLGAMSPASFKVPAYHRCVWYQMAPLPSEASPATTVFRYPNADQGRRWDLRPIRAATGALPIDRVPAPVSRNHGVAVPADAEATRHPSDIASGVLPASTSVDARAPRCVPRPCRSACT